MKSGGFHHEIRCFSKNSSDFTRFGVDFMKSARFHEIHQISYGFHEIRRISCEIERPLQGIVTLCLLFCRCCRTGGFIRQLPQCKVRAPNNHRPKLHLLPLQSLKPFLLSCKNFNQHPVTAKMSNREKQDIAHLVLCKSFGRLSTMGNQLIRPMLRDNIYCGWSGLAGG